MFLSFLGILLSILTIFLWKISCSNETTIEYAEKILQYLIKYLNQLEHLLQQQKINKDQLKSPKNASVSKEEAKCPKHRYQIRIIERSPLIIYIEHFLRKDEIEHLIQLG